MAFVQRRDGAIAGVFACAQPGYAEEELADDDAELVAFLAKAQAMFSGKTVQRAAIVRFTVAAGVVTTTADTVGIGAVTRISAGRYRAFYENADPDLALLPSVCVRDAADVRARVTSRTTSFVEVRTVNAANAAVDVAEVIVTFDKVLTT